jgi:hypothetical protein
MPPPRKPLSRSHIHRASDIYSPGVGDTDSIEEVGLGSIPDPIGAPDGQVPTTASGAYELAASAGPEPIEVKDDTPESVWVRVMAALASWAVDLESDDGSQASVKIRGALGGTVAELVGSDGFAAFEIRDDSDAPTRMVELTAEPGQDLAEFFSGSVRLRVSDGGYLIIKLNAAPADAVLEAGEAALWFDQTNGASKLMVKGQVGERHGCQRRGRPSLMDRWE